MKPEIVAPLTADFRVFHHGAALGEIQGQRQSVGHPCCRRAGRWLVCSRRAHFSMPYTILLPKFYLVINWTIFVGLSE
jgi:hypothetical protein